MASGGLTDLNTQTAILALDRQNRITAYISKYFLNWLQAVTGRIDACVRTLTPVVALTGQTAAISVTPVPLGVLGPGRYRVGWFVHVTTPATTSSAVQVTIHYQHAGVGLTKVGASLTANTTATVEGDAAEIVIDGSSVISYSATYSSVGGTAMQFALVVTVELVARA